MRGYLTNKHSGEAALRTTWDREKNEYHYLQMKRQPKIKKKNFLSRKYAK